MSVARAYAQAVLLPNGKVLVTGGYPGPGTSTIPEASAELYDPATGTWSPTGSMSTARLNHIAVLLPSGKVLVAGGGGTGSTLPVETELYDPATGTWSATGSLAASRVGASAALLPGGKVLIVGGANLVNGNIVTPSSAELYDPATGSWTPAASLSDGRGFTTAVTLPGGKVLVAGGGDGVTPLDSAELYDPATNTWSITGSMGTARSNLAAVLLPDGDVLAIGGSVTPSDFSVSPHDSLPTAELYVPAVGM